MSQVFKLFRLQQLDSHLDHARGRIDQINKQLADNQVIRLAEDQVNLANKNLNDAYKVLSKADNEVKSQRLKIEQTEAALYGGKVRNPKELQDLEKDVESLRRYLGVLEDRLLESMVGLEDAEIVYNKYTSEYQSILSSTETQHSLMRGELDTLMNEIDRLEKERSSTADTIESGDIKLYEQLRQQKRGVAVSKVSDNACSACGSILTPGMVQGAHSPTQLVRCPFCGRILYAG